MNNAHAQEMQYHVIIAQNMYKPNKFKKIIKKQDYIYSILDRAKTNVCFFTIPRTLFYTITKISSIVHAMSVHFRTH
jgi:hypothetical protein